MSNQSPFIWHELVALDQMNSAYSSQAWKIMGTESVPEHVQQELLYSAIPDFPKVHLSP
jgi:hypothetical protein